MTDKELIKQEIERKQKGVVGAYESEDTEHGYKQCCKEILNFINSLPEEPISDDLEKEIDNYIKDNFFGSKSMVFLSNRTKGELDSIDVVNIARHFAEWQKQKMIEKVTEWMAKNRNIHSFLWSDIEDFKKEMKE